jgi:CTP synthase
MTLPTVSSIYEVPLILESQGMGDLICNTMDIEPESKLPQGLDGWVDLVNRIKKPKTGLEIAIVGKYVDLHDSYMSVKEALTHAALHHGRDVNIRWVNSEDIEVGHVADHLEGIQGIIVPGGFGYRGVEGMIKAAQYVREQDIPYLGLCLGMQVMVIEAARNLLGMTDANSTEFDESTSSPVIDLMPDQVGVTNKGGTMRLGVYPCAIVEKGVTSDAYDENLVMERHRHRFEFNNAFREDLKKVGLKLTGVSPDGRLVEMVEMSNHPFMAGTQFHPEFLSRPTTPHPLFKAFVGAACHRAEQSKKNSMVNGFTRD